MSKLETQDPNSKYTDSWSSDTERKKIFQADSKNHSFADFRNSFEDENDGKLLEADVKMEVMDDIESDLEPSISEDEDETFQPRRTRRRKKKKKRIVKKELKQEKEELEQELEELKDFKEEVDEQETSTPGKSKKEAHYMTLLLASEPQKFRLTQFIQLKDDFIYSI